MITVNELGKRAKKASRQLLTLSDKIDLALSFIADDLRAYEDDIIKANKIDIENGRNNGMSESLIDRLMLNHDRIDSMAKGIEKIVTMDSPIGKTLWQNTTENGLIIEKITVPIGVIGIIFEARPNVTADAAGLCLKAQNAVILRGGKEAINSNKAIAEIMRNAIEKAGLPKDCICLVEDTSRESANELMRLREYLDILIPRGGKGLISSVVENAKVPVIETGVGNCHAFVDESADIDMAKNIVFNAKTSRVSVCNALETLLVHKNIAEKALPRIAEKLKEKGVEIRGCEKTRKILGDEIILATDDDFKTEFLDYIISVKVVDSFDDAVDHIAKYSSGHSETIITENKENAEKFLSLVDSAAVYVNASTRFTDGGEFGLGAEIGISTQKLHARGPMGTSALTSHKYIVHGNGQIR
ncbi:MAG: glutamate-5-semialdehyde dehydrogenase [Oscillospiraceae bacterium]|nr:glutamate-5-semialdehyde dehydrogenase [Candidatus Ruminococcus equi]